MIDYNHNAWKELRKLTGQTMSGILDIIKSLGIDVCTNTFTNWRRDGNIPMKTPRHSASPCDSQGVFALNTFKNKAYSASMVAESLSESFGNFATEKKKIVVKHTRDISAWVQEPCSRLTVYQQIGGALYDFIDGYPPFRQSSGKTKSLLTCIREESRMSDRTLRRLFLGQSNSRDHYLRIFIAIAQWVPTTEFFKLWESVGITIHDYGTTEGASFLEQQAVAHRTKKK